MREGLFDIDGRAFDLIIIGAGINGAGLAREAARRGMRALLLDKGDLCAGTSAWSSRLIHGGLRYLEHGEIGLVRESLRAREHLLKTAPHLVKPLPFLIPIYDENSRGRLMIRAGMIVYDLLSFDKSLPPHRMLSRAETIARAPGLKRENLRGAALYYDAQVEYAERLVVENALAAKELGAQILTYAKVERIIVEQASARGVEFTDALDAKSKQSYRAFAPFIINVAGAWVDEVLESVEGLKSKKLIGGTKGSHIIVKRFESAPQDALYAEAQADKRPVFVLPWNEMFLIGTTDEYYAGDLDCIEASEREIAYLLRETNRLFPSAHLSRDEILYAYAGVRPLPRVEEKNASRITRRHFIHHHAPQIKNLFSIIGGKLTTYKSLAEETLSKVSSHKPQVPSQFEQSGVRDQKSGSLNQSSAINHQLSEEAISKSADLELEARDLRLSANPQSAVLPGARTCDFERFCAEFREAHPQLSAETVSHLLRVYGVRAVEVLQTAKESPELSEKFDDETGALAAEVVFAFQNEMAQTLADVLLRRTMVGLNSKLGIGADEKAAAIARRFLGWSKERAAREMADYRQYLKRFHPRSLVERESKKIDAKDSN
jgi:glycerol-3-phosphate dehydrogenase